MSNKFLTNSLVTSKSTFKNLHATPKLKATRYEMVSESQAVDHLFGDALHTLGVSGGALPSAKTADGMKQPTVRLATSDQSKLNGGISSFPLEESQVAFEGANNESYAVSLDTTRTFLDSKLENDLKYRLAIQEYYLGKAEFRLVFNFNAQSARQTRAREMVLRMKSLPIRLVRRLVG